MHSQWLHWSILTKTPCLTTFPSTSKQSQGPFIGFGVVVEGFGVAVVGFDVGVAVVGFSFAFRLHCWQSNFSKSLPIPHLLHSNGSSPALILHLEHSYSPISVPKLQTSQPKPFERSSLWHIITNIVTMMVTRRDISTRDSLVCSAYVSFATGRLSCFCNPTPHRIWGCQYITLKAFQVVGAHSAIRNCVAQEDMMYQACQFGLLGCSAVLD